MGLVGVGDLTLCSWKKVGLGRGNPPELENGGLFEVSGDGVTTLGVVGAGG
jgi:hypothetical protein